MVIFFYRRIWLIPCFIFLFISPCTGNDSVLALATDPWPPYSIGHEGSPLEKGLTLDFCTEVSKRLNCKFKADLLPWKRVLNCMEKGTYDITFPIQSKPDREVFMVFTDGILEDRVFVWHLKDRKDSLHDWKTIDDLKPYTIGVISGYSYRAKMDQAIEEKIITTEEVNTAEYNFKKLIGKRIDAFLESESVVMSFFQKNPEYKKQITFAPQVASKDVYRIGISRKSSFSGKLQQLNTVIREMKEDGTVDRIMNKYRQFRIKI